MDVSFPGDKTGYIRDKTGYIIQLLFGTVAGFIHTSRVQMNTASMIISIPSI